MLIDQPAEGEQLPQQAMQPCELDDEPHAARRMFAEEHQAHPCALPFHLNQSRDLIEGQGWMPVVPHSSRALDQLHPHAAQPLAQFKVFPAVKAESGIEQSGTLQHLLGDGDISGREISP